MTAGHTELCRGGPVHCPKLCVGTLSSGDSQSTLSPSLRSTGLYLGSPLAPLSL